MIARTGVWDVLLYVGVWCWGNTEVWKGLDTINKKACGKKEVGEGRLMQGVGLNGMGRESGGANSVKEKGEEARWGGEIEGWGVWGK